MKPANSPRFRKEEQKLMVLGGSDSSLREMKFSEFPSVLNPGDLVVLNDAATLPASLHGNAGSGAPIEMRLAAHADDSSFWAVLFGPGDWRIATEDRMPPPAPGQEDVLTFSEGLHAKILEVSPVSARLIRIKFLEKEADWLNEIYRIGKPIQYSYLREALSLWDVQNVYSSRPWAFEMPSAGHALDWNLLLQIKKRGIKLASLTHAAGISSTGEPVLDAFLPLPERYDLPQETVNQILETKAKGKRVIAVGTSVVRALESAVHLRAGIGRTELRLNSDYKLRVVDGVLSGMHDTAESHFQLLSTFASKNLLQEMLNFAEKKGYLNHEFGDSCLILTK